MTTPVKNSIDEKKKCVVHNLHDLAGTMKEIKNLCDNNTTWSYNIWFIDYLMFNTNISSLKYSYSHNFIISMKTQIWYNITINVSCIPESTKLIHTLNMTINTVGMLKLHVGGKALWDRHVKTTHCVA